MKASKKLAFSYFSSTSSSTRSSGSSKRKKRRKRYTKYTEEKEAEDENWQKKCGLLAISSFISREGTLVCLMW